MAENLTVESFDTARIRRESGPVTAQAIESIWKLLNDINGRMLRGVRVAQDLDSPKSASFAPTTQQNDFDANGLGVVYFTGSTNFTLTGIRNGEDGRRVMLHNGGSATIVMAHENAGSAAANRLTLISGANTNLTANQTAEFVYLGSRWRQV